MHRTKRVVAWIPYGREQTISILHKYLLMDEVIDEIWLCMNTDPDQVRDREYANELAEEHEKIVIKPCPGPDHHVEGMPPNWAGWNLKPKQLNTAKFPFYMQDPNAVFIRFDDDIVWVHPNTPQTLVDRVLDGRLDTLGVFALIYNNAISSWFLQKHGRVPMEWGKVGMGVQNPHMVSAVDPVGWGDPGFAIKLHGYVLDKLENGLDDDLRLDAELQLGDAQQYSVSCFGISGQEYTDLNGVLDFAEEEHWLTMHRAGVVNRRNVVCGMAPVSHFTFYTQREEMAKTDILDRYRQACEYRWRQEMFGKRYYERLLEDEQSPL
jgi:hypothetical protein